MLISSDIMHFYFFTYLPQGTALRQLGATMLGTLGTVRQQRVTTLTRKRRYFM